MPTLLTSLQSRRTAYAPGPNTSRMGLAVVCLALVAFFSLRHDTFLTEGNATSIGVAVSAVAIAGVGTAILLVTGNVDVSIGGMYGFLGMVVAQVAANASDPVVPILAGLGAGLVLGTINGGLVLLLRISPLIVTIGLLAIYAGLGYVVDPLGVSGFSDSFIEVGRGELLSIPYPIIVAAAVLVAVGFTMTRTVTGLRLYAVGGDPRAAERAGVRIRKVVLGAYAFNGMLIGLIAVLTTARLGSGTPALGVQFEFDVLTAVILGGVAFSGGAGRPLGVLIGVLTIGVLNAGLIFEGLQDWWQEIARGSILLLALGADQLSVAGRNRRAARGGSQPLDDAAPVRMPCAAANGHRSAATAPTGPPVLEIDRVSKRFGAVRALQPTSLALHAGEVVAVLGDNGAGKSTLVKVVSGAVHPDEGELRLDGERVVFKDPADARAAGVETVYQDLALCPNLSVTHNLMLGDEPTRRVGPLRVRDDRSGTEHAEARLAALSIRLPDASVLVEGLSGGQRQAIAVARAMDEHVKVVCLDEPTAALGVAQTDQVLELVRSVADRGTGVLMITHDVASVLRVCDRVVVLRHGALVYTGPTAELSEVELLQLMAGMDIESSRKGRRADELVS